jgi:hypothetical protein
MVALQDNGYDYHVLINAVKKVKDVPGLTCEIGLREGGGTKYMIDALIENEDLGRTHIAIDCYGSMPYVQSESSKNLTHGDRGPYPNEMMKRTLSELYAYVYTKDIEVLFFPLEDTEFFARYGGGVPLYCDAKKYIVNQYAAVYLDGPHSLDTTMAETLFFAERSIPGSTIVYDDVVNYYDHDKVKEWLLANGWNILETSSSKNSYIKVE